MAHENLATTTATVPPWYGLTPDDEFSSLVLIRVYDTVERDYVEEDGRKVLIDGVCTGTLLGYVLVLQTDHSDPQWKMPGGRRDNAEYPLETAIREAEGETSLRFESWQVRFVAKRERQRPKPHWQVLFTAEVAFSEVPWANSGHSGNEGELPKYFSQEQFWELVRTGQIFPPHYEWLVETGLVLPLGLDTKPAA